MDLGSGWRHLAPLPGTSRFDQALAAVGIVFIRSAESIEVVKFQTHALSQRGRLLAV